VKEFTFCIDSSLNAPSQGISDGGYPMVIRLGNEVVVLEPPKPLKNHLTLVKVADIVHGWQLYQKTTPLREFKNSGL